MAQPFPIHLFRHRAQPAPRHDGCLPCGRLGHHSSDGRQVCDWRLRVLAVDKALPLVARLTLYTKDQLDGPVVAHTCGWAGGDAVELVPDGVVVRELSGGGTHRPKSDTKRFYFISIHTFPPHQSAANP
jgi:hypothetical protein